MSAMSDYLEGQIIMHIFRTGTWAKPTQLHFALYTSATDDASGGTEVTGGSYARARLDPADANWAAPGTGNGLTDNLGAITFPAPTANWGVITHMSIFDQLGNRLLHGALGTPKTVNNGDPAPSWPIGTLDVIFA